MELYEDKMRKCISFNEFCIPNIANCQISHIYMVNYKLIITITYY